MNVRAVIFDVYQTLLDVGDAPAEASIRWRRLWESAFGGRPPMDLAPFLEACQAIVRREHAAARLRGIDFPEVYWPGVMLEALPQLATLPRRGRKAFELGQARLLHTTALMPGAVPVLRLLMSSGVAMGIASNAQPYTLHELEDALTAVGLATDVFHPMLTFWSFQHGFGKPDPHVFQLLSARLRALGVGAQETLMVGSRIDTDVAPAQACGWRTFRLTAGSLSEPGPSGDWQSLAGWLDGRLTA